MKKCTQNEAEWLVALNKIFPVFLMVFWAVFYIIAVEMELKSGFPSWKTFLVNLVMIGSQIGRACIKNNQTVAWMLAFILLGLVVAVGGGFLLEKKWLIKAGMYANLFVFYFYNIWDMVKAGIIGSPSEKEDTDVQQCSVCENCPHMCERKAGIKTCSANAHTEQHVNKNIKNTFFNIIIQRPIQIANEKEENERISLQKSLAKEEETNE